MPSSTPPPSAPPPSRWRARVAREGALVGAAALGLSLGAMLGGAAMGVAQAAVLAEREARAPTNASPVESPLPAPTAAPMADEGAPPEDEDVDDSAPAALVEGTRPRPARATAGPSALDSAAYRVAPGRVTGYRDGRPVSITVTLVDGKPVEVHTAAAFERMRVAAARAGIRLRIVSGFRTMEHQRALYTAYRTGRGNLAALPGHSNHQSGHALDLNVREPGVLRWLEAHAREYGFRRTVPSESWHWERW